MTDLVMTSGEANFGLDSLIPGRSALVTGAGSGLGRASALALAAAGYAVAVADIDDRGAQATVASIESAGGTAHAVHADVAVLDHVAAAVAAAEKLGELYVLAAIAGIGDRPTPLTELGEQALDRVFGVNVKGTLFAVQEAAKVMISRRRGRIITMASTAVDMPELAGNGCYGITKAGIVQLTRVFAHELGPHGISVNALAPGPILTPLTTRHWTRQDGTVDEQARETVLANLRGMSPLQTLGRPEDVGRAVRYLAGPGGDFLTGQILRVNGGCAMPW